jgi:aminoglycoside phosphotransferase (APT) family kinase protein
MALTDQSTRIRTGEELDASLIDPYLKAHSRPERHAADQPVPGGASNLTYLLEYPEQEFRPASPALRPQGQVRP